MEKIFSFKKFFTLLIAIIGIIIVLTFIVLNILTQNKSIIMIFIVSDLFLISCFVALIIALHHKVTLFSNYINSVIHSMITEKKPLNDLTYDETLFSQIVHNLNRLYEILYNTKNKANDERVKLQELVSDISHQVKTPITTLKLTNAAMQSALDKPYELRSFIHTNSIHLDKLDFLLSALITTSRLETGIISLTPEKNNISDTVLSALENIILTASQKNIKIEFNYSNSIFAVFDPKWTSEALFNILDNAVKYTNTNGGITVSLAKQDRYIKISICDTGIGIAETEIPKIFARFYRSSKVNQVPGVGIGLYLARDIIQRQHGFIQVTSEVDVGSTFDVYLPSTR